jgi:hypothetical protein
LEKIEELLAFRIFCKRNDLAKRKELLAKKIRK